MMAYIKRFLAVAAILMVTGCRTATLTSVGAPSVWGPVQNGLHSQLQEIPNSYAKGYLKLLSLRIENVSGSAVAYDGQQVAINDPLIVKWNGVVPVPFRGEWVSSFGETQTLDPGCIAPLFYDFILEEQYDISAPGTYTVQFRGRPGGAGTVPIPPSNVITIRMKE